MPAINRLAAAFVEAYGRTLTGLASARARAAEAGVRRMTSAGDGAKLNRADGGTQLHELRFRFRWLRPALLALPLLAGCAAPSAEQGDPGVRATLVDERPGPPPLTRLLLDVRVRNDATVPRWVLIPTNLPARAGAGGVDHLEQRTAASTAGFITVGRLLGRAGTYALALAPGAQVTLRQLEIGWWREPPAASGAELEIRLVGAVTVGGQPIATWFAGDPLIRGRAEIDMSAATHTHSHRAPDGREVQLVASDVASLAVRLAPP